MKNERVLQLCIIVLLALVVLGFSVYYAVSAYNEVLELGSVVGIRGKEVWNVSYDRNSYEEFTGSVEGTITINTTSLVCNAVLGIPGEYYEFTIDVANKGNIDAELTSITLASGNNDYVDIEVKYGSTLYTESTNSIGRSLGVGESEKVYVKIAYKDASELTSIPENDLDVSVLLALNYNSVS